jgi:4-amino-4-deoxy-L-arabinose transferase-like glycosyltransferase
LWRYESIGELSDNTEKSRPFWFYIPGLFQIALPWTPLLVIGWVLPFYRSREGMDATVSRDRRPFFALAWYGLTVLSFSILNVKKNAYLLPMMPAQTLIIAEAMVFLLRAVRRFGMMGPYAPILIAQRILGLVLAAVGVILCVRIGIESVLAATIAGAIAAVLLLAGMQRDLPHRQRGWVCATALGYILVLLAFFNFYVTPNENARAAKHVCRELEPMIHRPQTTLRMQDLPEEASLYLPLDLRYDPSAPHVLVIVDDRHHVAKADLSHFPAEIDGGPVTDVRRIDLASAPGDRARWKIFELAVRRPSEPAPSASRPAPKPATR